MNAAVWLPLVSFVLAGGFASAILARDTGQRANRLIALVLACSAHWSLCEVLANLSSDADAVLWLIRLSSAGWLWLGPLCLDLYVEIAGDARSRIRKVLPFAYGTALVSIALYATPWCITEVIPTESGWTFHFGPLFPIAYVPTIGWVSLALFQWRQLFARSNTPAERSQALGLFLGIGIPMAVASITDVILPQLDVPTLRLGSTSIVVVGVVVAWSIRRYGYFLLAPDAFTAEILETLRDGVALVSLDGTVQGSNAALSQLTGRPRSALEGRPIGELIRDLPDETGAPLAELELELEAAGGVAIPVSVSSSLLQDSSGERVGHVLVVRDLREVATLRTRLVTSGRLAAVGELAAGIAHEISNPITFVRANLLQLGQLWETLEQEAEKTDRADVLAPAFSEGTELLEESVEGIDRITAVVRDVGGISHAGLGESQLVNVNELLENAVNVAALSFSVIVERRYAELPPVRCNPQQVKQVFLNLLLNALQAVGDYGQIRLVTEAANEGVVIHVEDDGCGIPEDAIERIFDPFFTTRPAGEGTGLGLALSYQTVRNHGGEIGVESKQGFGTKFRIWLPAADE